MGENMNLHKIWDFLKDKYVYTLTFAIACVLMLIAWIMGEIPPFGDRSLMVVDAVHQYLPFFSEYQEKLRGFESLQYSFAVGMGNNFVSLWSYYLSSPLNLIIVLFPKSALPIALNIIVSVKIILSALTFAYFLMHAGKNPKKNLGMVAFSLFYAFSSFTIGYYWNLMWIDCILVFPLIILGMEKMFMKNDSRMYILALVYSFVCNYYISFMICLFLILWFFAQRFTGVADFFRKGIRFAIGSLTAAALGAVVLIPAYMGIMTTASAEFALPKWEYYGKFADTLKSQLFCSGVMTNQTGDAGTNLYCGMITIMFAIMFFFVKDISLSKKVKYLLLLAFLVISFNNQQLNYIWHGFHNQYGIPNRFAFLYVFILLIMGYEVYLHRDKLKLPVMIASYIGSMIFVIYSYYHADVKYELATYIASATVLTLYLVILVLQRELKSTNRVIQYLLVIVALFEMAVNAVFAFHEVGTSEQSYYYGDTKKFETLKKRVEEKETDVFYRSDILEPLSVDEATWYNLNSIGIFGSTVRGEMVDIMGKLGYYTGANEYLYYGATPVTNALFGVKYVYTRDGDFVNVDMSHYDQEENISVYKNDYVLPIGYMVSDKVLEFATENNGPFTVQNELCGALTGIEPIFTTIYEDIQTEIYGTNIDVSLRDDYNASYTSANGSARVDMIFKVPKDMDLYVNARGNNVNKIALLIDGNEVAFDRYQGQIFHVGNMRKGQLVDIQFNLNDGENLRGSLYCYPMEFREDQFLSFFNVLANQSMKVTKVDSTKIEGTISVMKDGIFMTSIPYDEGWTIYANDKKVETLKLVNGFLGAALKEGDYTIKMVYEAPGLKKGLFTTLFGIGIFCLICLIERRKREKMLKNNKDRKEMKEEIQNEEKCGEESDYTGSGTWNEILTGDEGDSEGDVTDC